MSEYNDIDSSPSFSTHSLNPPLDTDIITLLAAHADYHTMLILLAANPSNAGLIRGLYNHHSPFWRLRVGIHTGKAALTAGPWSPKAQHDALLPRSGYLVHMGDQVETALRIKAAIHTGDIALRMGDEWLTPEKAISINRFSYVVLEESGMVSWIERYIGRRGRECLDDAGMTFTNRHGEELDYHNNPRIRMMVAMGLGIACLDLKGRLWVCMSAWQHSTHSTQFIEIVLPAELGGVDARISYIAPAIMYDHDDDSTNGINEESTSDEYALRITITDDGSEHLLYIKVRRNVITPIIVSIPEEATMLAHSSVGASAGWGTPDGHWDHDDGWTDESTIYPRVPQLVVPDMEDSTTECVPADDPTRQSLVARRIDDDDHRYSIRHGNVVSHAVLLSIRPIVIPVGATGDDVWQVHSKWVAEGVEGYARDSNITRVPILPHWRLGGPHYSGWGLALAKLFPSMASGLIDPMRRGNDVYTKTTVEVYDRYCSILLGDGTRVSTSYAKSNLGGSTLVPSPATIVDGLPGIWIDVGRVSREEDVNEYGVVV